MIDLRPVDRDILDRVADRDPVEIAHGYLDFKAENERLHGYLAQVGRLSDYYIWRDNRGEWTAPPKGDR